MTKYIYISSSKYFMREDDCILPTIFIMVQHSTVPEVKLYESSTLYFIFLSVNFYLEGREHTFRSYYFVGSNFFFCSLLAVMLYMKTIRILFPTEKVCTNFL